MLGKNIFDLRKKQGLSQEQLGEKVKVTRQTISNWELNETAPNPEQLKLLSKALNVSIDELLDNDQSKVLMSKISNTEKLAGITIKILKVIGIIFLLYIVFMVIAVICLGVYTTAKPNVESSATTICKIQDKNYEIEFGTNDYFKCEECTDKMKTELKSLVDFKNIAGSIDKIEEYFISNNGSCE